MKILFVSNQFYPIVGGIPLQGIQLIEFFLKKKHQVIVITNTNLTKKQKKIFNYEIYSKIDKSKINELHDWADIIFHNNISLRLSSLKFKHFKKTIVSIHMWINSNQNLLKFIIKKFFIFFCAERIYVSRSIKEHIALNGKIINNFYDHKIFKNYKKNSLRKKKIVFIGNLLPDKGLYTLLETIKKLKYFLNNKDVTIVGDGKYYNFYKQVVKKFKITNIVDFKGSQSKLSISKILNNHSILVVPSYKEPFGIVALEGLASGCITILSNSYGLSEFSKHFFYFFKNKNSNDLYRLLKNCITNKKLKKKNYNKYLNRFKIANVGNKYLSIFHKIKNKC